MCFIIGVLILLDTVWEECINHLRAELPEQQFNTWIRPLKRSEEVSDCLRLIAPNRFVLDWVNDKFLHRIEELAMQLHAHAPLSVELVSATRVASFASPGASEFKQMRTGQHTPAPVQPVTPVLPIPEPLELAIVEPSVSEQNKPQINPVDRMGGASSHSPQMNPSAANREPIQAPPSIARTRKEDIEGGIQHKNNLNKTFIFDNFVVGKSNQLGLAAATQVAENPGGSYNPLFIYGGVGLGKTHLMHAVGNALCVRKPDAKVVYLHSERFVADMVKALQLNAINDFKRYYRSVDALLIDDIQFFAGKERSQEEFFHTFNALLEGGQQIILTCDRYPKEINGLEERLKSRFGWGLTVAVEPPELETRVAILKRKAEQVGVPLPNDAAFFLAQRVRSNVRELEGALKRVIANGQFTGRDLSVELVREALKDLFALQDRLVSIDNIQKVVAEYYKIKVSDLHAKRRSRSVARPRQVAMYLAKDLTNHSLPEIGEAFGGRDHTTVLHAVRKIKELAEIDNDIKEDVKNLLRILTT